MPVALLIEDEVSSTVECERVAARGDVDPRLQYLASTRCADRLYREPPPEQDVALDLSSNGALVASAMANARPHRASAATAAQLEASAARETDLFQRALLRGAEAEHFNVLADRERSRSAARAAIQASPRAFGMMVAPWHRLGFTSDDDPNVGAAEAGWTPWEPFGHAYALPETASLEAQIAAARRAYLMGPRGYWPLRLGRLLLRDGLKEEARNVATQSGSDSLALELAMSEAHFALGYQLGRDMVTGATPDRRGAYRVFLAMTDLVDDALVLGRPLDFADDLVTRYLEPDPPLLLGDKLVPLMGAIGLCMAAPQTVGRRCIKRLRDLFDSGHWGVGTSGVKEILEGATAYVEKDYVGAAHGWQPLLRATLWNVDLLHNAFADAFDRAGEPELAERADARNLSGPGVMNGADLATVRAALRAEKRGDKDAARKYANAVIEAWSVADVPIPAVAEMRALLARLK
jgi:hypothetical protein